jgi:hypothetical protein
MRRCFVAQPFDRFYNKLYKNVFSPAVQKAGLEPYRVDLDNSVSRIQDSIENEIPLSAAVLVEISTKNPNVFLELGYAIAVGKPLCIVCSKRNEPFPFDIRHRPIIEYDERLSQNKKKELISRIASRLVAVTRDAESREEFELIKQLKATQDDYDFPGMTLSGICHELKATPSRREELKKALDRLLKSGYVEWQEYPLKEADSSCFTNFSLTEKGQKALQRRKQRKPS